MDTSTIIFTAMIAIFAYRGYGHGIIEALSRVGGMAAGYAAAIFISPLLARWLVENTELAGVLAYILAPPLLMMSTFWLVELIFDAIEQAYGHHVEFTRFSHYGGVIVGAILGVFLGIVSVWLYVLVRDALLTHSYDEYLNRPQSYIEEGVGNTVGAASSLAMGRFNLHGYSAIRASNFMAQPARIMRQAQALWVNPYMRYLYQSQEGSELLAQGNTAELQAHPAFIELLEDPSIQSLLLKMQLVDARSNYSEALAQKLLQLWQWLQAVKDDPEIMAIINDDAFRVALDSKSPTRLMLNDQWLELLRRGAQDRQENNALLSPTYIP